MDQKCLGTLEVQAWLLSPGQLGNRTELWEKISTGHGGNVSRPKEPDPNIGTEMVGMVPTMGVGPRILRGKRLSWGPTIDNHQPLNPLLLVIVYSLLVGL